MRSNGIDFSIDYYAVLDVTPSASAEEIGRSFRRLVLEAHPDKNPGRKTWSERRIRELIQANDVLGNEEKRRVFDRVRGSTRSGRRLASNEPFFFRRRSPGARALLVLHHLLNDQHADAVEILLEEEAAYGYGFLGEYLEHNDYLDCLFLLGEFFLAEKDFVEAARRLRTLYRADCEAKFKRHYHSEVLRLLKDLYLRKLPRVLTPETSLAYLEEASDLGLSDRENVVRLKRVAESQARLGDGDAARDTLDRILELDPTARGLERIEALLAG